MGDLERAAAFYYYHEAEPAGEEGARLLEWELLVPSAADAAARHPAERSGAHVLARDPWGMELRIRPV